VIDKKSKNTVQKVYFSEEQGFGKKTIIIALSIELLLFTLFVSIRFVEGLKEISTQVSFIGLSLITLIFIFPTMLLFKIKLVSTVSWDGICYRMKPFERKGHWIKPEEIDKYFIKRAGKPKEKIEVSQNNRQIDKRIKTGLQLQLKNKKRLFIETHQSDNFIRAVHRMMENNLRYTK